MALKYLVEANCENDRCRTTSFKALRKKMTYLSTDGHEHLISTLVCPECRTHGHVDRIAQVA